MNCEPFLGTVNIGLRRNSEIPILGSTNNAGNSVNFVSGIVRLSSGWDFLVCIGDRWQILFSQSDCRTGVIRIGKSYLRSGTNRILVLTSDGHE